MKEKREKLLFELKEHVPFAALATFVAVSVVMFLVYFMEKGVSEDVFHLFHFLHVIVSGMVTAGIFYKWKPSFSLSMAVGISGAVIIGSISDIIFPYLGWNLLGTEIHFHLPLIEETLPVLSMALFGSILGVTTKITKYPHFLHVFLSVFASIFYLLAFAAVFSLSYFLGAFFVVFVAVIIPCCLSDIIFPFFFFHSEKEKCVDTQR